MREGGGRAGDLAERTVVLKPRILVLAGCADGARAAVKTAVEDKGLLGVRVVGEFGVGKEGGARAAGFGGRHCSA